jgi:hypothetical protein
MAGDMVGMALPAPVVAALGREVAVAAADTLAAVAVVVLIKVRGLDPAAAADRPI